METSIPNRPFKFARQSEFPAAVETDKLLHEIHSETKMIIAILSDNKLVHLPIGRSEWVHIVNKCGFHKSLALLPPSHLL